MKTLLLLLMLIPAIQLEQPNLEGISQAIRSGNADALGAFFGSTVEISVMDKEDRYSKTDGVRVMREFFSKNKPATFNPVHQGVSRGGDLHYSIGEMRTAQGNYRVYMLLKDTPGNPVIQQLRIDRE